MTKARHEFAGRVVKGDHCLRCDKTVEWLWIPDSLASACKECGFVRVCVGFGDDGRYKAGATLQEWARDMSGGGDK